MPHSFTRAVGAAAAVAGLVATVALAQEVRIEGAENLSPPAEPPVVEMPSEVDLSGIEPGPAVDGARLAEGRRAETGGRAARQAQQQFTRPPQLAGRWQCEGGARHPDPNAGVSTIVHQYLMQLDPSGLAQVQGVTQGSAMFEQWVVPQGEWGFDGANLVVRGVQTGGVFTGEWASVVRLQSATQGTWSDRISNGSISSRYCQKIA